MYNRQCSIVVECILGFLIVFLFVLFVSVLVPQSFKSLSIIDLAVNNVVEVGIAVFISLFAVQRYETRRHNMVFVIDLIKRIDDICDSMKTLVLEMNQGKYENNNTPILLYQSYAKSIAEYVDAIKKILDRNRQKRSVKGVIEEMSQKSQEHIELFMVYEEDDDEDMLVVINEYAIPTLLSVQAYIPTLLSNMRI